MISPVDVQATLPLPPRHHTHTHGGRVGGLSATGGVRTNLALLAAEGVILP
ncbi:MAG: hypothetical protein JO285_07770 [Kutzneria sp.]|nr:hypothetical protein [Kutzneria sp.]